MPTFVIDSREKLSSSISNTNFQLQLKEAVQFQYVKLLFSSIPVPESNTEGIFYIVIPELGLTCSNTNNKFTFPHAVTSAGGFRSIHQSESDFIVTVEKSNPMFIQSLNVRIVNSSNQDITDSGDVLFILQY
jgi:hypothetical protein